jgi:3-hydroxymyristoyl/3-hydroxydecanoyl-(acyl carrier protein) dehydratase
MMSDYSPVVDPIVIAQRVRANAAEVDIVVPEDLRYFQGHFPGAPVVPGVVQIKWAIELARRYLAIGEGFAGMEALKFQRAMTPGLSVTLALEHAPGGKLRFAFASGDVRYSSGRVLLRQTQ